MLRKNRLVYLWCLSLGGILSTSILRGSSWYFHSIAAIDSSRWAHFLVYALVSTIPVAAWRYRRDVAFCLVPVLMSVALESLQAHTPGPVAHIHNVSADIFGIAAGILLGLNLHIMHNSAKSSDNVHSIPSRSDTY
jgi:hypothetical protein